MAYPTRRSLLLGGAAAVTLVASSVPAFAKSTCIQEPDTNKISFAEAKNRANSIINNVAIGDELDGIGSTDASNIQYHLNNAVIRDLRRRRLDTSPLRELQQDYKNANKAYYKIRDASKDGVYSEKMLQNVPERYRDIVKGALEQGHIGNYGRVFGDMSQKAFLDTAKLSGSKEISGLFGKVRELTQQMINHANSFCGTKPDPSAIPPAGSFKI